MLLALCLAVSVLAGGASAAYTAKYTPYADALFGLGLFNGYGIRPDGSPDYRLEKTISRAECIVMLLRLLGEEDAALSARHSAPFRDMNGHWAAPYVEYAYSKGYTSGTTAATFSPNATVNAKMYLTFLLRTLGYRDKAGDFTYQTSCQKAAELGICPAGAYQTGAPFYRDDCVLTSYFALCTKLKGSEKTLLDTLAEKGAVDTDRAELTKLIGDPAKAGEQLLDLFPLCYVGNSYTQIQNLFPNGYRSGDNGYVTSSLAGIRFGQITYRFDNGTDRPCSGAEAPLRQFLTDMQRPFTPADLAKAIGGTVLDDRIEAEHGGSTLTIYPKDGSYTVNSRVVYTDKPFVPSAPESAALTGEWLGETRDEMVTIQITEHSGNRFVAKSMESVQKSSPYRAMAFEDVTFTSTDGVHYSSGTIDDGMDNRFSFTITVDTSHTYYTALTLTAKGVSFSQYTPPNYMFPASVQLQLFS